MSAIIEALKKKHGTPAGVMKALGLPVSLLYGGALDEEPELDPAERLHRLLKGKLSAEELKAVGELLEQLANAEDEEEPTEAEEEKRLEKIGDEFDDTDEDDAERVEKLDDVVTRDRLYTPKLGKTAMDAADALAFDTRFPAAPAVNTRGLFAAVPDRGEPRKVQSAAQAAAFDARFPNARKIS